MLLWKGQQSCPQPFLQSWEAPLEHNVGATIMGAQVFTTCGSAVERAFLLGQFPSLDDDHIASIGSWAAFESMVKRGTGSEGVDLILSTVDGEDLQVSTTFVCHAAVATRSPPVLLCVVLCWVQVACSWPW